MEIYIRHLYKTCLQESAYIKLIKKYASKLEYDILIVFDLRIKDYGNYIFDSKKKLHSIKISPNKCGFTDEGVKLDDGAEKYHLISTTIHEIYHALQYEELGREFWNKKYGCATEITHPDTADFFSKCEIDARAYENKNLLQAVEYYSRCVEE